MSRSALKTSGSDIAAACRGSRPEWQAFNPARGSVKSRRLDLPPADSAQHHHVATISSVVPRE
jgi:hypothetical protein